MREREQKQTYSRSALEIKSTGIPGGGKVGVSGRPGGGRGEESGTNNEIENI